MPGVMRLMVTLVMLLKGSSRSISGSLYRSRVMRDHTYRSRKRQRTLHGQEATEQKNNQTSVTGVHTRDGNTDGYQPRRTIIRSNSGDYSTRNSNFCFLQSRVLM